MADEAVIVDLLGNRGDPVEYTVATGTAIPKGTLMMISASPQTAVIATAAGLFAGIAANEKTATDGVVKMPLLTHCIAELTCGAAESMVLGGTVMVGAAPNEVTVATGNTVDDAPKVVGIAQETVAGNGTGSVLINVGKRR